MKTRILLIYTGGTIGMAKDYTSDSLKPFDFENLIKHIPELSLIDSGISFTGFETPIDSSDMNPSHWVLLAEMIENKDRKSTRLNSSHVKISYAVFCLKK